MIWNYSINYGSGDIGPNFLVTDTYGPETGWRNYSPTLNIQTTGAATITILGTLGGAVADANKNGTVGFDSFDFVTRPVPEPATATLALSGLAFVIFTARKSRLNIPIGPRQ